MAPPRPRPGKGTSSTPLAAKDSEIRPNRILSGALTNHYFALWRWDSLSWLLAWPLLFLLFLGWHRRQQYRSANSEKFRQQGALKTFRATLRQLRKEQGEDLIRQMVEALQLYLAQRLNLEQRNITAEEAQQLLARLLEEDPQHLKGPARSLCSNFQRLESSLYSGQKIENLPQLQQQILADLAALERLLPPSK